MKKTILYLMVPIILCVNALGQGTEKKTDSSSDSIPTRFWKASLPGGEYMVSLSSISSIAKHTYIVDGAARVYEVTVADKSSAIARFYYIEPVTDQSPLNVGQVVIDRIKGASKDATNRIGAGDVWDQVVKNYPSSTHAKTMEFRLTVRSNIDGLYESVARAWEKGKGENFKIITK